MTFPFSHNQRNINYAYTPPYKVKGVKKVDGGVKTTFVLADLGKKENPPTLMFRVPWEL